MVLYDNVGDRQENIELDKLRKLKDTEKLRTTKYCTKTERNLERHSGLNKIVNTWFAGSDAPKQLAIKNPKANTNKTRNMVPVLLLQ